MRARLDRQVPSQTGRLDVVQARLHLGRRPGGQPAVRRLGAAVGADGGRRLAASCPRRPPGCPPAPRSTSPCTDDRQPVRQRRPGRRGDRGLAAGHAPQPAARRGSRPSRCGIEEAARPGHRRPGLGPPVVARLRRRGHGRHRGARGRHLRRDREQAAAAGGRRLRGRRHRRPDATRAGRGGHARGRAPHPGRRGRAAGGHRAVDRTSGRSARTSRPASCCCPPATGCGRSTWRRPPRPG